MSINTFEDAVAQTKKFTEKPGNDDLLTLYGLYKQVTEGDNATERPGGFDFKAAAKYNAWMNRKGKSKEEAADEYIQLVNQLSKTLI